jgi:hypothetical protein
MRRVSRLSCASWRPCWSSRESGNDGWRSWLDCPTEVPESLLARPDRRTASPRRWQRGPVVLNSRVAVLHSGLAIQQSRLVVLQRADAVLLARVVVSHPGHAMPQRPLVVLQRWLVVLHSRDPVLLCWNVELLSRHVVLHAANAIRQGRHVVLQSCLVALQSAAADQRIASAPSQHAVAWHLPQSRRRRTVGAVQHRMIARLQSGPIVSHNLSMIMTHPARHDLPHPTARSRCAVEGRLCRFATVP